MFKLTTILG